MKTYNTISLSVENGLAEITLNRPDNANSMNLEFGQDILDCAIELEGNSDIRAVLLTGTGKMFSAGGDLNSFLEYGDEIANKLTKLATDLHAAIARLRHMNAPIIVAVNGSAAGAGLSLAVSGDYVLASDKAKFMMAYSGIGFSPDGSASHYLPRLIGLRKTQELMLMNRVLDAQEALDWGLINQVIEDSSLADEAKMIARKLADGPTQAYGAVKQLLNNTYTTSLETQMDRETRLISTMSSSDDGKEGIKAFVEKRKPKFFGR